MSCLKANQPGALSFSLAVELFLLDAFLLCPARCDPSQSFLHAASDLPSNKAAASRNID